MSSANCFNLDQSKILSSGNGLTVYQTVKESGGLVALIVEKTFQGVVIVWENGETILMNNHNIGFWKRTNK